MTDRFMTPRQRYAAALRRQQIDRTRSAAPVPERITSALDLMGLYGPDVDRACGVEEPAVDQWETGELVPTREQVEALARLTGFPTAYFYVPHVPLVGVQFLCGDDGCEIVDHRPDEPVADVIVIRPKH